jgi:uncharacterized membrane protein
MSKGELHAVYIGIIAVLAYWAYTSVKSSATNTVNTAVNNFNNSTTGQVAQGIDDLASDEENNLQETGDEYETGIY